MSQLDWREKDLEDSDLLVKLYDVRNDSQYEVLYLSWNNLTSLPDLRTFSQFDNLKVLDLRRNNIKVIDFSLIPSTVTNLNLSFNELTSIGCLSKCTKLEHLDASSNQITHVNWRSLPTALTLLYLHKNELTTVEDVSQCTRLSVLDVHKNHINHIDWRNLPPALTGLHLDSNQLTTVDLFHCTQLKWLNLSGNHTLHSMQSLPNNHFVFSISKSVKVLGRKCFHENTYNMLVGECRRLKWQLQQPPVEVLFQGLEAVLEYYKLHSIRTTHTR